MDAVRIHRQGNLHVVIDHKRNLILSAKHFKLLCLLQKLRLVKLLFSQLDKRRPALQSFLNLTLQSFPLQPCAVCHRVKQHIFRSAVHLHFLLLSAVLIKTDTKALLSYFKFCSSLQRFSVHAINSINDIIPVGRIAVQFT